MRVFVYFGLLSQLVLGLGALTCAHVNPKPPPQKADCATACDHLTGPPGAGLDCPANFNTCMGLCVPIAINNPDYPGCLLAATNCDPDCDTGR